jgi:hypothetical protein
MTTLLRAARRSTHWTSDDTTLQLPAMPQMASLLRGWRRFRNVKTERKAQNVISPKGLFAHFFPFFPLLRIAVDAIEWMMVPKLSISPSTHPVFQVPTAASSDNEV